MAKSEVNNECDFAVKAYRKQAKIGILTRNGEDLSKLSIAETEQLMLMLSDALMYLHKKE